MNKKLVLSTDVQAWLDSPEVSGRPRVNIYICEKCHGQVVTKDIDAGVTPFMISCRATPGCIGAMASSFYRCDQSLPFQFEFYRPESLHGFDSWTVEHLKKGGLILRPAQGTVSNVPHDA
jgi:hypothetical protein